MRATVHRDGYQNRPGRLASSKTLSDYKCNAPSRLKSRKNRKIISVNFFKTLEEYEFDEIDKIKEEDPANNLVSLRS